MSDDKKESALRKALETAAINKELQDKLDALEKKIKKRSGQAESDFGAKLNAQKGKTKQAVHALVEERRANQKDVNLHMTNVATLILQGAPRFRALMNLILSRRKELSLHIDHVLGFDAHGGTASNWVRKKGVELSHKFSGKKEIDIPDLKYFADVTEDGFFEMYWIKDTFAGLFTDESGNYSEKNAKIVQSYLEEGIEKWLESRGYCMVVDDTDPKKVRLYDKNNVGTHLKADQYKTLRDNGPDSLGDYLRKHFFDVNIEASLDIPDPEASIRHSL
jgi:hypothetical protein